MRVLIITDSLGCPRAEIDVSDTWTDRIIKKWSSETLYFYTLCKHGLSSGDIDVDYVRSISPDLIIIQIGIVDACRRALGRRELWLVQHIPIIRKMINILCNKFHYLLTRARNVHYCSVDKFDEVIRKISDSVNSKIVFISIAPPGAVLRNKVYNIVKDIDGYNRKVENISEILVINPYMQVDTEYILPDGHHLNLYGQEMVFGAVDMFINDFLREKKNE